MREVVGVNTIRSPFRAQSNTKSGRSLVRVLLYVKSTMFNVVPAAPVTPNTVAAEPCVLFMWCDTNAPVRSVRRREPDSRKAPRRRGPMRILQSAAAGAGYANRSEQRGVRRNCCGGARSRLCGLLGSVVRALPHGRAGSRSISARHGWTGGSAESRYGEKSRSRNAVPHSRYPNVRGPAQRQRGPAAIGSGSAYANAPVVTGGGGGRRVEVNPWRGVGRPTVTG